MIFSSLKSLVFAIATVTSSGGIIIPSVVRGTEQKSTLTKSHFEDLLASQKTSLEDTTLSNLINYEPSTENIDKNYSSLEMKNISSSSFLKGFFSLKRESDKLFKNLKEVKDNKSNFEDLIHSQKMNISSLGSNFWNNILRDFF